MVRLSKTATVNLLAVAVLFLAIITVGFVSCPVFAANPSSGALNGLNIILNSFGLPTMISSENGSFVHTVNAALLLIGAISILMLILGGIRYKNANGEASIITAAKNTILYSIIVIILAILAYVIINFIH